jgi:hypothetical protein
MNDYNWTEAELAYWIGKYLIFQGTWSFTSLVLTGGGGSPQILAAAASQDIIGWTEFLHGKVSTDIGHIQEVHCALSPCRITGADWMKMLVTHLVQISHSQWIFWNFTLHDKHHGYLQLKQQRDLLGEVDSLLNTPLEEVPEGSKYLLELDFLTLYNASFEQQSYWVLAVKAAQRAGRCNTQSTKRKGISSKQGATAQQQANHPKYNFMRDEIQMRQELGLAPNPRRRMHPDPNGTDNPSNKCLRKPD